MLAVDASWPHVPPIDAAPPPLEASFRYLPKFLLLLDCRGGHVSLTWAVGSFSVGVSASQMVVVGESGGRAAVELGNDWMSVFTWNVSLSQALNIALSLHLAQGLLSRASEIALGLARMMRHILIVLLSFGGMV
jgi:hypothetical protein